jgi:hypothetical protein
MRFRRETRMNALTKILEKLGLFQEDVDYGAVRAFAMPNGMPATLRR